MTDDTHLTHNADEAAAPKTGRPSSFTQDIADAICERLANGESLRSICLDGNMPAQSTVFRWLAANASFREQYAHAREAQADALFDESLDIADDGSNDWMRRNDPENAGWQANGENIQRSKLRIETRRWMAGKLRPKVYGEKTAVEHGVSGEVSELLKAIDGTTRGLPSGG
ncbi:terminase small subunit protein [Labrys sp. KB_33_2]|uniref:terminase small subunit-like protein n=1 Tax=Labrys sp. KB_33_2 TaxID=3237479 RepID=UPI003F8E1976